MARIERSEMEKRRIGQPSDASRIDVLERLVIKLAALAGVSGSDADLVELGGIKDKLDQLDTDFPDSR